jgi:hypothetical protein
MNSKKRIFLFGALAVLIFLICFLFSFAFTNNLTRVTTNTYSFGTYNASRLSNNSKLFDNTTLSTLSFASPSISIKTTLTNMVNRQQVGSLSLERKEKCNLPNLPKCFNTNKSLVISFWTQRSRSKWLSNNLLNLFPEEHYDYVVMVHDNSSWTSHKSFRKIVWIVVDIQQRFWYIKRFIPIYVLKAYKYIWIVDDDAHPIFNPLHYECVVDYYNISLSSPIYAGKIQGIHAVTRLVPSAVNRVGRWTDFVEIGPVVVAKSSVWQCLWHLLSPAVGLGYGLDNIWCKYISFRCLQQTTFGNVCAILDTFGSIHDSPLGMTTGWLGVQEMPAYNAYYSKFSSKITTIGTVANDLSVYNSCIINN